MRSESAWTDAQRLEGWAGEIRVNVLRLLALAAFYAQHLVNAFLIHEDPTLRGVFHAQVTALVLAWAVSALALHVCLVKRIVPSALKFVASGWDLTFLTLLLILSPDGPKSWLAVVYFLIVAAAGLRLSLPLVWMATLGSLASYLLVLGHRVFVVHGSLDAYYRSADRVPRTQQLLLGLGLAVAGLLAGQSVRLARLVLGYPVTVEETQEKAA